MSVTVTIASDANDLQACLAIRAAAFLARGEPYHEEYDGNDLVSATHLLARQGPEPVGTMRIRILSAVNGGTVVWERLAVTSAAKRGVSVLNALADTAKHYTIFKGCRTAVGGVADPRLIKYWHKRGFKETGKPPILYNGIKYIQMAQQFNLPRINAMTLEFCDNEAHQFVGSMNGSREEAPRWTEPCV